MWCVEVPLVIMLLLSTVHGQYQIHFEQRHYTFPESSRVCVRVRHVGGPAPRSFSLSYSFDAVLIGQTVSGGVHRATHLFQRGTSSTRLCLTQGQGRNNQVCEPDTVGTITLINSSAIRVVEPFLTSITITDDEFEFARFSQPSYTFHEDSGTQHLPLIIISGLTRQTVFTLTPDPLLNSTSSLSLETRELTYEPGTATTSLAVALRDDHVALQQPKQLSLGILLSSSQCYDLTISSTLITILDSDVVRLEFTEREMSVRENEGQARLCVAISHVIARPLNFVIIHDAVTSGSEEKGGSIFGRFPAFSNTSERCYTLTLSPDNIVGNDRQFTVRLDVDESSYPTGVMLRHPTATVSIQDTSTCHDVSVDNSTERLVEVPPFHSVCFHCLFTGGKAGDVSWKIGGLILTSGVGEVLSDGTLQVTNSSSVFRRSTVAMISCSSLDDVQQFTFPVLLQGGQVPSPTGKSSSRSSGQSRATASTLSLTALLYLLALYLNS